MEKIKSGVTLLIEICGGWFSLMSGGLSIPFALFALYVGGSAKTNFWALAFVALLVFAVGVTRKNYSLLKAKEMNEVNSTIQTMPDEGRKILVELYRILIELKDAGENLSEHLQTGDPARPEAKLLYQTKVQKFTEFYFPNKIYVPATAAEKVRQFSNAIHSVVLHWGMVKRAQDARVRDENIFNTQYRLIDEANKQIPDLLKSLEEDIQKLIGVPLEIDK